MVTDLSEAFNLVALQMIRADPTRDIPYSLALSNMRKIFDNLGYEGPLQTWCRYPQLRNRHSWCWNSNASITLYNDRKASEFQNLNSKFLDLLLYPESKKSEINDIYFHAISLTKLILSASIEQGRARINNRIKDTEYINLNNTNPKVQKGKRGQGESPSRRCKASHLMVDGAGPTQRQIRFSLGSHTINTRHSIASNKPEI